MEVISIFTCQLLQQAYKKARSSAEDYTATKLMCERAGHQHQLKQLSSHISFNSERSPEGRATNL